MKTACLPRSGGSFDRRNCMFITRRGHFRQDQRHVHHPCPRPHLPYPLPIDARCCHLRHRYGARGSTERPDGACPRRRQSHLRDLAQRHRLQSPPGKPDGLGARPGPLVPALGRLPNVDWVELQTPPVPQSLAWFQATNVAAARAITTGSADVRGCVVEDDRPTDTSSLRVGGIRDESSADVADHSQQVMGVMSNTFAPQTGSVTDQNIYMGNIPGNAGLPPVVDGTAYGADFMCPGNPPNPSVAVDWSGAQQPYDQIGTSGWHCIYNSTSPGSTKVVGVDYNKTYRVMAIPYNNYRTGMFRYQATPNPQNPASYTPTAGVRTPALGHNLVFRIYRQTPYAQTRMQRRAAKSPPIPGRPATGPLAPIRPGFFRVPKPAGQCRRRRWRGLPPRAWTLSRRKHAGSPQPDLVFDQDQVQDQDKCRGAWGTLSFPRQHVP